MICHILVINGLLLGVKALSGCTADTSSGAGRAERSSVPVDQATGGGEAADQQPADQQTAEDGSASNGSAHAEAGTERSSGREAVAEELGWDIDVDGIENTLAGSNEHLFGTERGQSQMGAGAATNGADDDESLAEPIAVGGAFLACNYTYPDLDRHDSEAVACHAKIASSSGGFRDLKADNLSGEVAVLVKDANGETHEAAVNPVVHLPGQFVVVIDPLWPKPVTIMLQDEVNFLPREISSTQPVAAVHGIPTLYHAAVASYGVHFKAATTFGSFDCHIPAERPVKAVSVRQTYDLVLQETAAVTVMLTGLCGVDPQPLIHDPIKYPSLIMFGESWFQLLDKYDSRSQAVDVPRALYRFTLPPGTYGFTITAGNNREGRDEFYLDGFGVIADKPFKLYDHDDPAAVVLGQALQSP